MFRRSLLRPLLRWISLVLGLAVLTWLGRANMHQRNFPLFLGAVLGLAVLIVGVFVATGSGDEAETDGVLRSAPPE